ncbi:GHKL domain-containing protein [Clostridium sartagoforme]|uniref:histidine kinase n=1 Tax=Clostridium sartagoforme TaxID=84031 RepID=A0A4V3RLG3_9CLOT|nr:HAMP domain-containing sensor histidine kinase [Clostridium sartagoforme]TGY43620.1 GHKL domain-containing protein [Clostridium sartagoforme]
MFEKLKRKFIFINMTLLTLVFILIFGTIYLTTAANMDRELEGDLKGAIQNPRKPGPNFKNGNSIIIDLDSENNVANVTTNIEIDNTVLEESIYSILKNENKIDKIDISGSSYGYLKEHTPKGLKIALISRELQINMLNNLLKVFLIVGSISLFLLFYISVYLTNKTIKPIKESFEKQKQFIADASHELKTPLAIIRTNTSVITSNKDKTVDSQIKWINYISNQVDRMAKLIDDMLSLTKLDSNKVMEEKSSFDLSKVLDSILLGFEAVVFENNIILETEIQKNVDLKAKKEEIKKLCSILLDNALKYTNSGGRIDVILYEDKNKVYLKVKNTGDGIKKEDLEKIFERFYRIDTSRARETGGYGLGLSIAKSIVESHNGKIYAESNIGKDTTFIVEFTL